MESFYIKVFFLWLLPNNDYHDDDNKNNRFTYIRKQSADNLIVEQKLQQDHFLKIIENGQRELANGIYH